MSPFIVYALPRSRTAWMSSFLTYGGWICGHEQAIFLRHVSDITKFFSHENVGTVETAAAQAWRIIKHHVPNIRQAVVRRPLADVFDAMMNVDLVGYAQYDQEKLWKVMAYGNRMLDEVACQPGTLRLEFDELDCPEGCKKLFEFCIPYEFDFDWWERMRKRHIEVSVPRVIQYYHDNITDIMAFKKELWREMRHLTKSGAISRH